MIPAFVQFMVATIDGTIVTFVGVGPSAGMCLGCPVWKIGVVAVRLLYFPGYPKLPFGWFF